MSVSIQQGEDKTIIVRVKNSDNDPIDLSSASAITATFQNTDGTELECTLGDQISLVSGVLGKFQIELSATETAALLQGTNMDLPISYTIASKKKIKCIERVLSVGDCQC